MQIISEFKSSFARTVVFLQIIAFYHELVIGSVKPLSLDQWLNFNGLSDQFYFLNQNSQKLNVSVFIGFSRFLLKYYTIHFLSPLFGINNN